MNKFLLFLMVFALASTALSAPNVIAHGIMGPDLAEIVDVAREDELIPVNVVLREQADPGMLVNLTKGMDRETRKMAVVSALKGFCNERQDIILAYLELASANGLAEKVTPFWVLNAIHVEATPQLIDDLLFMDEVWYIESSLLKGDAFPTPPTAMAAPQPDTAWGVLKINAPAVWLMGYTGDGIVVGVIDTGVNHHHVDLLDHLWTDPNYPNHGWDFLDDDNDPMDTAGHGTHCAGSIAGDGTAGCHTGVAPDAQIMAMRVRTVADSIAEDQMWAAMQFAVSPPLSPSHGADVISMSLGFRYAWNPRRAAWRTACTNVGLAGVAMIVAAGNERGWDPPPNDLRCPGDVPPPWRNPDQIVGGLSAVISIGATDISDAYASFSSEGPVAWNIDPFFDYAYPPGLLKPDVCAPGVNVKSLAYNNNNGYADGWDGTSMATPHVAGTVALMLQKNLTLSPEVVDQILETTALDLGDPGKDNDYGAGRIQCLDAINLVPSSGEPYVFKLSHIIDDSGGNNNGRMDPGETVDLIVTLMNSGLDATNVQAALRESDPDISVTDSTSDFGDILSDSAADNSGDPYVIVVDPDACEGSQVPFTLHITADGAYENDVNFSLTIGQTPSAWETHNAGNVRLTVTGFGALGYTTTDGEGDGFEYPKYTDHLYYGGMAAGNSSSYVVDRFYNPSGAESDWETILCQGLKFGQAVYSDQDGWVRYDDAGHSTPDSLEITQDSWAWGSPPHDDYVIIRYTMKNAGASALNGLYLGQFADFDMGADAQSNYAGTDATRRLGYMYANASGPYVGVTLLDPKTAANLSVIDHDLYVYPANEMSEQTKMNFLNGTISVSQSNRAYDWSVMVSAGPFDLAPGESVFVAVLIVGGNNLTDIQDNSDDGQEQYDGTPGVAENTIRREKAPVFALYQNNPNPFSSGTHIQFITPDVENTSLTIFDVAGRVIKTFHPDSETSSSSSRLSISWDGTDVRGQKVPSGVYFYRLTCSDRTTSRKMVITR